MKYLPIEHLRETEEKFLSCKVEMRQLLLHANYVSLTTDLWCNVKMQLFLSVTIHFLNEDCKFVILFLPPKK